MKSDIDWEVVRPLVPEPCIAIYRDGAIAINSQALELLGQPEYIHVLVDRTRRCVGLRHAEPDDEHTWRMPSCDHSGGKMRVINGPKRAIRRLGLAPAKGRSRPAIMENGILYVTVEGTKND